jgi:hypothetical protein
MFSFDLFDVVIAGGLVGAGFWIAVREQKRQVRRQLRMRNRVQWIPNVATFAFSGN